MVASSIDPDPDRAVDPGVPAGTGVPVDPGVPDRRGPVRYFWWLVTCQRRRVALGALLGSLWMVGLTLPPYVLSRAVDDGLRPGDYGTLAAWTAVLFGVGVLNALLAILRHRTMTRIRQDAYFRTVRVVVRHATRLGAELPKRVTAGEVVTIGHADVGVVSQTLTLTGPGVGAVLAYLVVAALLLSVAPLLALVVLLGVPLLVVLIGPPLGRLQKVESVYREREGGLAAVLTDLVSGLRVLNGLGGKEVFTARYRESSRELRDEGYRVGAVLSWIQAFAVGLPTLFLAAVTWLAARMAAQGTITVGELVAVYGYVAVLVLPVLFLIEAGYDITHGLVATRRILRFLRIERMDTKDGATSGESSVVMASEPIAPGTLRDPVSGVVVAPGTLTALVSGRPADSAAVVDRVGRFAPSPATWGSDRLDALALDRVRARILVADNEADLFAGTVRTAIAGQWDPDDAAIASAVDAAMAGDIVLALPDGLASPLDAQARNLSGGQRQRIRLARALLADPEVLLAVDPTSAVDAHTEAAMASRLRTARAGRTTLVTSTSPLVLDQADAVYYLVDGHVTAVGTHHELLAEQPGYRVLVSRGLDAEPQADDGADGGCETAGAGAKSPAWTTEAAQAAQESQELRMSPEPSRQATQ
ncbi:ABC transporter transmembrane domain-containing protein [Streptomyces sp. NPDC048441]|uniref:ABC transporter transmembrane domain-containing protein n=1 Tax=Streptomyces sp. NPDC048441 TaxID=3365552 RepID=UPI00371F6A50